MWNRKFSVWVVVAFALVALLAVAGALEERRKLKMEEAKVRTMLDARDVDWVTGWMIEGRRVKDVTDRPVKSAQVMVRAGGETLFLSQEMDTSVTDSNGKVMESEVFLALRKDKENMQAVLATAGGRLDLGGGQLEQGGPLDVGVLPVKFHPLIRNYARMQKLEVVDPGYGLILVGGDGEKQVYLRLNFKK